MRTDKTWETNDQASTGSIENDTLELWEIFIRESAI